MTGRRVMMSDVVHLGALALDFGQVERITQHVDGRLESDTTHTVMLALVACSIAEDIDPALDRGRVAQYALVHDLVEAYAGDTPTLRQPTADQRAEKRAREADAFERLDREFGGTLPWIVDTIAAYDQLADPEARFVKALDKLLPKITHLLNGCRTLLAENVTVDELDRRYRDQSREIAGYASEFPGLLNLYDELAARVLTEYNRVCTRAAR